MGSNDYKSHSILCNLFVPIVVLCVLCAPFCEVLVKAIQYAPDPIFHQGSFEI